MENSLLSPKTQFSKDGKDFRSPTMDEVFESAEKVESELLSDLAKVREAVADAVTNSGEEPFNFGLDWACSDPTSVGDFVKEVLKNFTLVKNEEE